MNLPWFRLLDPITRKPLQFNAVGDNSKFGYLSASDSLHRWPVVLGISFLRSDRLKLAETATALVLNQDFVNALALLLQDTDDFAPVAPQFNDCLRIAESILANDTELLACDIMEGLQYGPVAKYFAVRGSAPTFFSGLGLLKLGVLHECPLVEVGCGVGHFLHWLSIRDIDALGTDSVFSKLYLAHRCLGIEASHLICAVAGKEALLPLETLQATNIFCHDVFYFIKDKLQAIADFRRLAGDDGCVMVGHAHLSTADHGIVSGHPLSLDAYRQITSKNAHFFDDASLVSLGADTAQPDDNISDAAEAISFVEGRLQGQDQDKVHSANWWNRADDILHAPIEVTWSSSERSTTMNWPSEAFAQEYRSSNYLTSSQNPFEYLPFCGDVTSLPLHPGLAIPAPFFSLGTKPLRWGIIGAGWITADYFVPAFKFVPHAKLVGLADTRHERLDAFLEIPGLKTFTDWREMVAVCELDAVYIATPNYLHAEIFEGAAAYGVRILCEKPIATNQSDLDRIRACTRQTPNFFQTAFDQRYHPAHVRLAKRVAEGFLGTATQLRIHYACWLDGNWNKAAATDNWRIDSNHAGGGAGFDLLPHCLDLICMLTNDSIATAHLLYQGRIHEYATSQKVDDGALMIVKTAKGVLASAHVGYNCPENQPRRRIEIIGTHGRVEAHNTMGQDPGGELIWQVSGQESRETFPTGLEAGPFVRQLDALSRQWIRGDLPQFPIEQDVALAECLIRCDAEAKKHNLRNS